MSLYYGMERIINNPKHRLMPSRVVLQLHMTEI